MDRLFPRLPRRRLLTKQDKPAADPLLLALEGAGIDIDPKKLWYIGDTVTDLEVSAAVGCKAILLLDGENKDALIAEYKAFSCTRGLPRVSGVCKNSFQSP